MKCSTLALLSIAAMGFAFYRLSQADRRRESRDLRRALNEDQGRMNTLTGARGMAVDVEDAGGGRTKRRVGRGVIQTPG